MIVDEAHHVVAKTWKRLTEHYARALLLGLTATPQRADGKPLGDIFDSMVIGATVRELTRSRASGRRAESTHRKETLDHWLTVA